MTKEFVGVIFGVTSPFEFKFLVMDAYTKKGDYVRVMQDSDWILAQVASITISNESFSLDVASGMSSAKKFANSEEKKVAKAVVIGLKDDRGKLRTPKMPFSPGSRVYKADHFLIKKSLGLASGEAYIGLLEGTDVLVRMDVNKLVQHHCSILAKTGSGKSYTSGVIIEELLEWGVPLLIIDPHGEYSSLKRVNRSKEDNIRMDKFGILPRSYDQCVTYTPSNLSLNEVADEIFRIDGVNPSAKMLSKLMPTLNNSQRDVLYRSVKKVAAHKDFYTISDVIREVDEDNSNAKWNVVDALETLESTKILSECPTEIEELMCKDKASIIDMRGVEPELQDIIVSKLCYELWESRKMGKVPPGMVVIEEAHEFCPERGYKKTASSAIIRTIASEGRKFGLGLMVISQRPARVDKNVLSQCHTQIILKITNANDLKALSKGLEGMNTELEEEIKRLSPGVALFVSDDIERPILVEVRPRKSSHGGESVKIVETAQKEERRSIFASIFKKSEDY